MTCRPTGRPTNRETDRSGHREVTLPINKIHTYQKGKNMLHENNLFLKTRYFSLRLVARFSRVRSVSTAISATKNDHIGRSPESKETLPINQISRKNQKSED